MIRPPSKGWVNETHPKIRKEKNIYCIFTRTLIQQPVNVLCYSTEADIVLQQMVLTGRRNFMPVIVFL